MIVNKRFINLQQRLKTARGWASDVTEGNRCALVIGATLKLKPGVGDATFQGVGAVKEAVQGQPLLDKFFLKAQQLADRIEQKWPSRLLDIYLKI